MGQPKALKERIENLNQLIDKEPNKANDIISSGSSILKQLNKPANKKELETDYFTSMREKINKYMSHKTLNDTQKEKLMKMNNSLKELNNSGIDSSRKQPSEESSKSYNLNQQQKKATTSKINSNNSNIPAQNINKSFQKLSDQIQGLDNSAIIKKELDKLKADLSFKIEKQFRDRKEMYEELETLPVTLKDLAGKIDSIQIPSASGHSSSLETPKDEQAVVDLTKFMKEGLDQFEYIAKYYLQNQSVFDKTDKINQDNQDALTKSEEVGFEKGKKAERISVATKLLKDFPEIFNRIKSVFEDIITEEYEVGKEIDITQENRKEYEIKIKGITAESKIIIKSSAILIAGKVIEQATIKEDS